MTRYWLTDDEKAQQARAAEINVAVGELEVAESVARTFTADLRARQPLTYDALETAYQAAMAGNGGVEPRQIIVSPRRFAEIESLFQPQQRMMTAAGTGFAGMMAMKFQSAVIVSGNFDDSEIGWSGINGHGVLRLY